MTHQETPQDILFRSLKRYPLDATCATLELILFTEIKEDNIYKRFFYEEDFVLHVREHNSDYKRWHVILEEIADVMYTHLHYTPDELFDAIDPKTCKKEHSCLWHWFRLYHGRFRMPVYDTQKQLWVWSQHAANEYHATMGISPVKGCENIAIIL